MAWLERWLGFDTWQELFSLLWRNKLRALLTAFSVAWGVFMLVLLLAAGRGLQNGVERDFRDDATNSIWVRGEKTSLPYGGRAPGRDVRFVNDDIDALLREVPGIEYISGRFYLWGNYYVRHGTRSAQFDIRGCHPEHLHLEKTILLEGRFINPVDVEQRRKVAVIGPEVRQLLFGAEPFLGEYIQINGVQYQVVGLFDDEGGQNELRKIYIPISTAQLVYHGGNRLHHIMYTIGETSVEQSAIMVEQTRSAIARRHQFSPNDRRALQITNNLERFRKVSEIFAWIRVFVWVVGIGTLFAGVMGVSNIMLISVRERTVEIGIRKALGATPWAIVKLVLLEALLLTAMAGYVGLVAGTVVVELIREHVPENDYLREPRVDFEAAVGALVVLVIAGVLAGLMPALRAASVKPVVAMRGE